MKTKYFLLAVLCCAVFGACQNDDPNNENTEVTEQLGDFVDGIGKITATETLDNGTVVMKDDKGNTITKDKDGNIVIVSQQGDSTYIDNSIKENGSDPKDKWYHTTWKGRKYSSIEPYYDNTGSFISNLEYVGFDIQASYIDKDSTKVYNDSVEYINLHFNTTTCSWQNVDTLKEIIQTGVYTFKKCHLSDQQVNGYTLKVSGDSANLFAVVIDKTERVIGILPIDKDSTIIVQYGYKMTDKTEKILETGVNTTFFNYRRVNDTQIAIINNSVSYLLKEENSSNMPKMEIYKDGSDQNISLELVSL